ncbi:hypothetical protein U91I_01634 [alpha proteobacterium U9-1i]|nr:hypothetical protein U91I_01634 [alpha proteobacterium U9-1i]
MDLDRVAHRPLPRECAALAAGSHLAEANAFALQGLITDGKFIIEIEANIIPAP